MIAGCLLLIISLHTGTVVDFRSIRGLDISKEHCEEQANTLKKENPGIYVKIDVPYKCDDETKMNILTFDKIGKITTNCRLDRLTPVTEWEVIDGR